MSYLRQVLYTAEQLEAMSTNRKHGISPVLEDRMKRSAIDLIVHAGQNLRMEHMAISTAVVLFHRYYATHSFLLNEKFLIAMACLYLGGKLEDTPKSARDVISACCLRRYGPITGAPCMRDPEFVSSARERVFLAERAVLYALRFDVVIEHPFQAMLEALQQPPLIQVWREWGRNHSDTLSFQQICINLLNDSYKLPLCLMFPGRHIALACIWTVMRLLKIKTRFPDSGPLLWWQAQGMTPDELKEISSMLLEKLYTVGTAPTVGSLGIGFAGGMQPKRTSRQSGVKRKAVEEEYNDLFDKLDA